MTRFADTSDLCDCPFCRAVRAPLYVRAVPSSAKSSGTAAADTNPQKEATAMPNNPIPDPVPPRRPANILYSGDGVTVVADVAGRPELVASGIDTSTLTPSAVFRAGPLTIRFDDPATADLWASAFEVTAAQLRIAAAHADEARHDEMAAQ